MLVPAWMATILPGDLVGAGMWPASVVASSAGLVALGYVGFCRWGRAELLLAPLLLTLGVLTWSIPSGIAPTQTLWIGWLNLACVLIGALVSPVGAAAALGAGCALSAVAVSGGFTTPDGQWSAAAVAVAALAVADCLVAAVCADVLRDTGRRTDFASARRAQANAQLSRLRAGQAELARMTRLIHDTVVNTLGAVARLPQLQPGAVAERVRADLRLLDTVERPRTGDPRTLLQGTARHADLLGLSLAVDAREPGPPLDPMVYEALDGAGREGLTNIAKHAGVTSARVSWAWDGDAGRMEISDSGVGFDASNGWAGGAAESVAARCRDAGVTARVRASPGHGTRVELTWSASREQATVTSPQDGVVDVMGEVSSLLASVALRFVLVLAAFGVLSLAATPLGGPTVGSLLALALLLAMATLAHAVHDRRFDARRIWWGVYPLGALLCTALPQMGLTGCQRLGVFWWGDIAGLAFTGAVILVDRRAWVVAATAAGYVAGGAIAVVQAGPGTDSCAVDAWANLLTNLAVLVAVWALARRLHRTWAIGRAEQQHFAADLSRRARIEETARIRQELFRFARAVSEPLMVGLAGHDLDPRDPQVRARCAHAESTLRALAGVPIAEPSGSGRVLAQMVIDAHRSGVTLSLSPGGIAMPAWHAREQFAGLLAGLLPACRAGSTLRLTTLPGPDTVVVLALIDTPQDTGAASLTARGWTVTSVEGDLLAEVELPRSVDLPPLPEPATPQPQSALA